VSATVTPGDLARRDVATRFGPIALWSLPGAYDVSMKPVVLAIGGSLSPIDDLKALLGRLGILADACLMRMPGSEAPPLSSLAVADISLAVEELVEAVFPGRPVVLLGASIGAVVALGVRAANVARIVAVEPPLLTAGLWPIVGPLRDVLGRTQDPLIHALAFETYGVGLRELPGRNYLPLLEGLDAPTDVILAETPLEPERPVDRFPSLVSEEARRRLAANPRVRLHLAKGAGHNAAGQAPRAVRDVLLEACRRAAASAAAAPAELDEALLEATPLTARRLLYWGPHGAAFCAAVWPSNPRAEVVLAESDAGHPSDSAGGLFDAVIAAAPPPATVLARLAQSLRPDGHLVARWADERDALARQLAPLGLALREPVDEAGTGVIRAQKRDGAPEPALRLKTLVYSGLLMDIRTRLPARGLASDPELSVSYGTPPSRFEALPPDRPKVLVLQRIAELNAEAWRPMIADAIRGGWIVVLEYDDHPQLVAELRGYAASEADMLRFGFAHAVQTSTAPLVEAFRPYNPEVVAFANAAFELAPFPHGERPKKVFYGGVVRGGYAAQAAASLGPAIAAHPETEFVVVGDREVFDALPTRRKQHHEYMSFEAYLRLMGECAVSLSPLAPLPLRDTKSDAKFIDGARSGALTIASPTVYGRVIEHGVNGLVAADITDWAPLLSLALADQAARSRMARLAWEQVRDGRMFADQIALRRDWYRDLWARRAELNEALMGRLPGLRELVGTRPRPNRVGG
jgi:hypothetical protein